MPRKPAENGEVPVEPARNSRLWRDDAINWLHNQAENLPVKPETPWHVARPSTKAQESALHIIQKVPINFVPVDLTVTLDQGIELDWRNGQKELEIEIFSDGSFEVLQCESGSTVNERKLPEFDWPRLDEAFAWLERL